jgi:hypothetical protein
MFEIAKVAFHPVRFFLSSERLLYVDDTACWQLFAGQSNNLLSSILFFCKSFRTQFFAALPDVRLRYAT